MARSRERMTPEAIATSALTKKIPATRARFHSHR